MAWEDIEKKLWNGSVLRDIVIDEDDAVVYMDILSGGGDSLVCRDCIGISYLGRWSEMMIHSVKVFDKHPILTETQEILRRTNSPCTMRRCLRDVAHDFRVVTIVLTDGIQVNIVCADAYIK